MKKIVFFSIFLLILSFSVTLIGNNAYAEISDYSFTISCLEQTSQNSGYVSTSNFNSQTNTYWAEYSTFLKGASVFFTVSETSGETNNSNYFSYQWASSSGTILSTTKELILYRDFSIQEPDRPLLKVGETKFILQITNQTNQETKETVLTVAISDNNSSLAMQTNSSNIPSSINSSSEEINFYATIPTTATTKISWYIKSPNSSSFSKVSSQSNFCFAPNNYINQASGYGSYKVMAIGKTSQKTYYSNVYTINAKPEVLTFGAGIYSIKYKKITNSKTNIEAFEYTINNTNNMISEYLCWYVNGTKICNGFSLKYEPTTTDEFKVVARYNGQEVASRVETPKPTDTYILYIILGASVIVLVTILVLSIKITNRKRDVVW